MDYCNRCVYPANARPGIVLDEEGVCSGCRASEQGVMALDGIDWVSREEKFKALLDEHKAKQDAKGNPYHCVIPVSGGKDSLYQVYVVKELYGLNPLCVTYNHTFNTPRGIRNLANLVDQFDVNLVRYTTAPGSAKRMAKYMLEKVGDVTWHYHAGMYTFPIQAAVQYDVPLMIWGEEGFSELTGLFHLDDMVEFTKKKRQEHSMRGFEPEDLLNDPECPLTRYDLAPFFYPKDEDIERVGIRGVYISNYIRWDQRVQSELMINQFGFETGDPTRQRTFNIYAKLDDVHADGLHDYLKYLKFGYGRATDDAANEVRHGRMTREEAIDKVAKHDHVRPDDMDIFLNAVGMKEEELYDMIEPMRDPAIWEKDANGIWRTKDSVINHRNDPGVDKVRVPMRNDVEPFISTGVRGNMRDQKDDAQTDYVLL